jgi:isoleucyl-tRNA synthetase
LINTRRLYLVNSPVVKGEQLRFKEEGVKEIVAKVFLPWYNSYRFFFSQVALLKNDHDVDFKRSAESMNSFTSTNVMDRWILASLQSLIKFVHQEMEAYRLYTVVPRLLRLIDDITNWYIRFNRKRLKGENGVEDTLVALSTLHEVLYSMTILMVSPISNHLGSIHAIYVRDNVPEPQTLCPCEP